MTKHSPGKYWYCEPCAKKAGGTFPSDHVCTVTMGTCAHCGTEDVTLIPWIDFDWTDMKKTRAARMGRD